MNLKSIIETILFVYGESMSLEKLAKAARKEKDLVEEALHDLQSEYRERGFLLLEKNGKWQLGSNPENAEFIADLLKSEFSEELSRAALETLAIVAYKGPITRAEIEFVRGVNSSFTLRNLLMRGLLERAENEKDARAYLYQISFDFLKHFGISRLEDLPRYEEFKSEKSSVFGELEKIQGSPAKEDSHGDEENQ